MSKPRIRAVREPHPAGSPELSGIPPVLARDLTAGTPRLGGLWFMAQVLLLVAAVGIVIIDVVGISQSRIAFSAVEVSRLATLGGLIGLIVLLSLYLAMKRNETDRLKADLWTQRVLTSRIEGRTSELESAIEQLKALDEMKDTFVSTVSHEIRTPLTAIQSYSEVLMTRDDTTSEVRIEFLRIINREAKRLALLIEDLQDLARLEAGRVEMANEPCSVSWLVGQAMESIGILAQEKSITVLVDVPATLPSVSADGHRVVRVLTNLIGNAVKFTPVTGRIEVAAAPVTETVSGEPVGSGIVKIEIKDTGCGIPAQEIPLLFNRFYRGAARETRIDGSGLGLAISKEIVERLGGTIGVTSTIGQGSVFYFTLPVHREKSPAPRAAAAASPAPAPAPAPSAEPSAAPSATPAAG